MNSYKTVLAYWKKKNSKSKKGKPPWAQVGGNLYNCYESISYTHKKGGWYDFFNIENTQKTILKTRLYELICSAFSQPLFLTADFGCVTKKIVRAQKQTNNPFKNKTREREKEWGEQNFSKLAIAC